MFFHYSSHGAYENVFKGDCQEDNRLSSQPITSQKSQKTSINRYANFPCFFPQNPMGPINIRYMESLILPFLPKMVARRADLDAAQADNSCAWMLKTTGRGGEISRVEMEFPKSKDGRRFRASSPPEAAHLLESSRAQNDHRKNLPVRASARLIARIRCALAPPRRCARLGHRPEPG